MIFIYKIDIMQKIIKEQLKRSQELMGVILKEQHEDYGIPSDTTITKSGQQVVIDSSEDGRYKYNFTVEFFGIGYDPTLLAASLENYDGIVNEKLVVKIQLPWAAGNVGIETALDDNENSMNRNGIYFDYDENGWGNDIIEFRFYLSDNSLVRNSIADGVQGESTLTFSQDDSFSLLLRKA